MNNIFNAPNKCSTSLLCNTVLNDKKYTEKYTLPIASCCLVLTFIIKIIQFVLGKKSDTTE